MHGQRMSFIVQSTSYSLKDVTRHNNDTTLWTRLLFIVKKSFIICNLQSRNLQNGSITLVPVEEKRIKLDQCVIKYTLES